MCRFSGFNKRWEHQQQVCTQCMPPPPAGGITQQLGGKLQGMMFCCLILLHLFICSKQAPPPHLHLHKYQHDIAMLGLANATNPRDFGLIWTFAPWLCAGFCSEVCKTFSSWQWVQGTDPVWPVKTEVSSQKGDEQQKRGEVFVRFACACGLILVESESS